jgi:ribonuclease P protein component
VDDLTCLARAEPLPGQWLGMVVPKRHARPAVMRTLFKRQIRAVMAEHAASLPPGLWIVRLRAGFDRRKFVSASSQALRRAAHAELVGAFGAVVRGTRRRGTAE